jgi:hypothetical protein
MLAPTALPGVASCMPAAETIGSGARCCSAHGGPGRGDTDDVVREHAESSKHQVGVTRTTMICPCDARSASSAAATWALMHVNGGGVRPDGEPTSAYRRPPSTVTSAGWPTWGGGKIRVTSRKRGWVSWSACWFPGRARRAIWRFMTRSLRAARQRQKQDARGVRHFHGARAPPGPSFL